MTGKSKINIKRAIKYSWIAINISLVQLSLGSYVLYPEHTIGNSNAAICLFFLSFPSSIPAVALASFFVFDYPPILDAPFDYLALCLVVFISGCLQWLWFVPRIMKKHEIVSLHLTSSDREPRAIPVPKRTRRRKSYQPNLPRGSFDKTGHSPLERAIGLKRR